MTRLSRLAAGAALAALLLVHTPPSQAQVPQILPPGVRLELPFVVNGTYVGDITVQTDQQGVLLVDRSRLIDLLSERLTASEAVALNTALPNADLVMAEIVEPFANVTLDTSRIEIAASVPLERLRARDISLGQQPDLDGIDPVPAADAAAAIGFNLGANYIHEGGDPGFSPIAGRVYGFVNLGGAEGWSLDFEAFYQEDADQSFRRGDLTLFRDFPSVAARLALGDVIVPGGGFQGTPQLGGVSYQRLYSEIDPFRSVRPTGRTSFVLEADATVDVLINGNLIRTIRFGAGSYDLTDIPFAEGANQVELVIRQDDGFVQTLRFDAFSSSSLLSSGLSEFGVSAGLPAVIGDTGIEYERDLFTASGFYRFGASDRLTLGASAQANPYVAQLAVEATGGFSEFLISSDLALSAQRESEFGPADGVGLAGELNVRYRPTWAENGDFSIDFNAIYTDRDFANVTSFGRVNPYRWEYSARTNFTLFGDLRASVSAGFREARDAFDDVSRYTVALSRRIGPFSANASYEFTEVAGADDHRFLISAVWTPRGGNFLGRASYDSVDERYRTELSYLPGYGVGSVSGTLAVESSEAGDRVLGTARYLGNRFTGSASHSAIYDSLGSDVTSQVSSVSVQSGIAFAGGASAIGPVGQNSFAIIDRGPAVPGARVLINPTERGHRAQTDLLGGAVVPTLRGFAPSRISAVVDSDDIELLGNDLSEQVVPGSRTGYRLTIGEKIEVTVMGRALNSNGDPIGLSVGSVTPVEGGPPLDTFTNSTGRFVVENVSPGRYRLALPGEGVAVLSIGEDARGFVDVGTIIFTEGPEG
ncbi:MAG: fimbria/pilus outer membrane usher protein [Oceanicaulis sp.]